MIFSRKKSLSAHHLKQLSREIDPDEIFLDSKNLPEFDKNQFEGRLEKPIGKKAIFGIAFVFFVLEVIFFTKVIDLQVIRGDELLHRSENNRLDNTPIFAMRGTIYDRNGEKLAWNSFDEKVVANLSESSTGTEVVSLGGNATTTEDLFRRSYTSLPGLGHVLGYVSYPKRDSKGFYYQESFIGKDGVEEKYNDLLSGKNGLQIVETDALGNTTEGSIIEKAQNGIGITLGIDAKVEAELNTYIKSLAEEKGFIGGSGAIMDVQTGELLALTSYPEYKSSVLSEGKDEKTIQSYQTDKRSVFLDRAVSGVYAPGSVVKPIMAIGALNEGVITPEKQILSTGSISIPNPYYPDLPSVFMDWKAHGWVDMRQALAVSSDVYFYEIGGGFEGQKGIGIANIEKYARMFGLGSPTGVDLFDEKSGTIPDPEWKAEVFNGEPWRLGDTYNTVIGQYGFQVTPLQMIRATAALANDGILVTPHLLKDPVEDFPTTKISIPSSYFQIVREGMRDGVLYGTDAGLNVDFVKVAAKTGTAEVGAAKKYINSWVVGFFPYDKPRYAFAVVMEKGPYHNTIGGVYVMRQMLDWMHLNTPEYLKSL